MKPGKVESYLLEEIERWGAIHFTLIDPEEISLKDARNIAKEAEEAGTTAIMVGGSTVVETGLMDRTIKAIKKGTKLPVIIFPNNIASVSRYADAIWFLSLLNSSSPYFITGIQAMASKLIRKYNLEAIPLGYIIVGEGRSVSIMGSTIPLPYDKPEIIASYALASELLGMHFVYLETGSGAKHPIPPTTIEYVKRNLTIPLIVGGGIMSTNDVYQIIKAGADAIVTGTLIEREKNIKGTLEVLIKVLRSARITHT